MLEINRKISQNPNKIWKKFFEILSLLIFINISNFNIVGNHLNDRQIFKSLFRYRTHLVINYKIVSK